MLVSLQCAHTVYARVRTCDEMNHRDGLTRSVQPCDALRSLYLFCFVNGVSSTSLYESVRRKRNHMADGLFPASLYSATAASLNHLRAVSACTLPCFAALSQVVFTSWNVAWTAFGFVFVGITDQDIDAQMACECAPQPVLPVCLSEPRWHHCAPHTYE
jgi:hypothetical protein